ncbi:MAG: ammonium transporter [Candidatus Brocadiales bacterium]|nr:ammonium transporter [Candidatus Bathyanammoxibius amoris]
MNKFRWLLILPIVFAALAACCGTGWGAEGGSGASLESVVNVQKYNRSIHVMAMLLVGFGFLMVFVRRYGLSTVTATFLVVSVAIPLYIVINSLGILGEPKIEIDRLLMAEFAAASLLICIGAPLGRLKMPQYMLLGIFFIPCYMINEWILLEGGLGLIPHGSFVDTGGSILIHAFGALFGLGVVMTMTTQAEFNTPIESDATSDRFSMLGSMVLWLFWPSFCAGLVAADMVPFTAVNVILSLCGATIATYFASVTLRGKICIADIANAALAGGVAIGATCDHASHPMAFIIGILAGALSTYGFAVIQDKLQGMVKGIDTCGVTNLHGWPGIFGGLVAVFVVADINKAAQLKGILIAVVLALIAGYIAGKLLASFGRRTVPYVDSEEFGVEEASPQPESTS